MDNPSSQISTFAPINPQLTLLANSPSRINPNWAVCPSVGGKALLEHHTLGFMKYIGGKRLTDSRIKTIDNILANLVNAAATGYQLLYSRSTAQNTKVLTGVIEYLEASKLIDNAIGKGNQYQQITSYIAPTEKLIRQFQRMHIRISLIKNASMVIVRNAKGKEKSLKTIKARQPKKFKLAELPAQQYNHLWTTHTATLNGNFLIPYCRRIFNNSLDLGGRFYGASHLLLPKAQRQHILIDGEQTIEPDFKAMHYCLLYALAGIELNPLIDDPYTIEGFSRDTAKITSLILLNSENLAAFKANVTKSANPTNKAIMQAYQSSDKRYKPPLAQGFIYGLPDNLNGSALYNGIAKKHKAIAHYFGSKNIGLRLQKMDGDIMSGALVMLGELDVPVLPVHDSIRCRISDKAIVIEAMRAAYQAITGFNPCICQQQAQTGTPTTNKAS